MDEELKYYRKMQLIQACPMPLNHCGTLRIKVHSDKGESNWLTVSVEELKEIEAILVVKEL